MPAEQPEPSAGTVLVVDDEPSLREALQYTLRKEGFRVEVATSGPDAIAMARKTDPDIIVLDVMLPGVDGLQVCRTLRSESTVPILLLSAKGEEIDRVVGLEMGADDYLGKPFAMRELLARIRALLRRVDMMKPAPAGLPSAAGGQTLATSEGRTQEPAQSTDVVAAGDLVVDRLRMTATLGGTPLSLRPKEFDLLYFLVRHPGVVHSRNTLLHRVWGYDFPMGTRTVDVHVRWLRQKLEQDPGRPTRIETVRGYGYRLTDAAADGA